jgi:hypothetical protein
MIDLFLFKQKYSPILRSRLIIVCAGLFLYLFLLLPVTAFSQASCNTGTADTVYDCSSSSLAVGVQTIESVAYNWYKDGSLKQGPVPGNGGAISFNFAINSLPDAGHYTVERVINGNTGCSFNTVVIYNETVSGLVINSLNANSVSFSWPTKGKCEYVVSPSATTPSAGIPTTKSTGSAAGLSGSTTYFIYARSICDVDWTVLSFTTPPGPCNAYVGALDSILGGAGSYCIGSTVQLSINNTQADQQYSLLQNGSPVAGATQNGNGGSLSFPVIFSSGAKAGIYRVRAIKPGCNPVDFGNASVTATQALTGLATSYFDEISVNFSWASSGADVPRYEYAVTTSATAPASGTLVFALNAVVNSLTPSTLYHIYVRPYCNQGTALNWATISFTTLPVVAPGCSALTSALCVANTANIPAGEGAWDFGGPYPVNGLGVSTPGKELIYRFTPAATGVYYLDIEVASGNIAYLYKNAAGGCSNTGWTGIVVAGSTAKYPVGMLQSGITYLFLLDNPNTNAVTHRFKICAASVTTPSSANNCVSTVSLPFFIPANSPKEEYVIDNAGNVIAALDFSNVPQNLFNTSVSYYVNTASVRRDAANKEYLDRNFTVSTGAGTATLGVKLFFSNTELQQLINQPDDGLADVNSIADLKVSLSQQSCLGSVYTGSALGFVSQSANASLSGGYAYIQFSTQTPAFTAFLNGGTVPLVYQCPSVYPALPVTEGFNNAVSTLPLCWTENQYGSNTVVQNSTDDPDTDPFEGTGYLFYNSANFPAGDASWLFTPPVNSTGVSSVDVEFYWLNSNFPDNTSNIEGVQLEYSVDGVNWNWANFIQRHDGSLPVGTGQWEKKKTTLPAGAGNQPHLYISYVFFSQNGHNCAMDALKITPTPNCTPVPGLDTTSVTPGSVNFQWNAEPGVTGYQYSVTGNLTPPASGISTTGTTGMAGSLLPGAGYFIHVRPECSANVFGDWGTLLFITPLSSAGNSICPGGNINFSMTSPGAGYAFNWQVDKGAGFINISDNSNYAGSGTSTLNIMNAPSSFYGYKYRCIASDGLHSSTSPTETLKFSVTWNGSVNTAWDFGFNYNCGVIPDANTDVIIPAGLSRYPVVSTNGFSCRSVLVKTGGIVTLSPGITLNITGR